MPLPQPDVRIAGCRADWEAACRLAADAYRSRGYAPAGPELRFTPYHALPDTALLVASAEGRLLATLTVVPDGPLLGLPMEEVYSTEVNRLRQAGRRLAEVIGLADAGLPFGRALTVLAALMRLAAQYGASRQADAWVIAVNPRHRAFYQKALGFVPLGPRRDYPSVQGHPAEAYTREVEPGPSCPPLYRSFFAEPLPAETLRPRPVPAALAQELAGRSDCLAETQRVLSYLERFGDPGSTT